MSTEPKLDLDYWLMGALQPDLLFNALLMMMAACGAAGTAKDKDLTAPPGSPAEGDTYIVGPGATSDWAGHDDDVAYRTSSAWEFYTPSEGWEMDLADEDVPYRFNGSEWVKGGTWSGASANTGAVGNVGAGEDDLLSFAVPAATLAANGQRLTFRASGSIANNANAKRLRVKFGATTILDTGAAGIPVSAAIDWVLTGEVIRTGAATQVCNASLVTNSATFPGFADVATAAETLSGAVTLKLTGEAVSNNDVVQETLCVDVVR